MSARESDHGVPSTDGRDKGLGSGPHALSPSTGPAEFAICAVIYAVGQGCNVLFQLLLLRHFGALAYGEIGLAHLAFLLVGFVGDLGYATILLREKPDAAGWERQWRLALGHKLLLTLGLYALTLGGWVTVYGRANEGFAYLAATVPAGLAGLASLSPALLAGRRRIPAFLVQQIPWPAALMVWALVGGANGSALQAGLIVSAGFAVQPLVGLFFCQQPSLLLPLFGAGSAMLGAATRLSAMGIAGALHDRLTPFLVARLAPDFLPLMLLLGHGMNGASGILMQVNRLLLPHIPSRAGLVWSGRLFAVVLVGIAATVQFLLLALAVRADGGSAFHPALLLPTLLAWGMSLSGGVLATELIGRHRESRLARVLLLGLAASAALQISFALASSADGVLWARLIGVAGIAAASLGLCGISLNRAGWAICGSLFLAALAPLSPLIWAASALLLIGGTIAAAVDRAVLYRDEHEWSGPCAA